jgi:tetratricopeptide (TPR) repeat protein
MVVAGVLLLSALGYIGWQWNKRHQHSNGPVVSGPDAQTLEFNNRGVAWMEFFEYAKAEEEFQQVVSRAPGWLPGQVNLAIATYNQATPEKIERAVQIFDAVLTKDPENPHAHFCLGYLLKYQGRLAEAARHFEAVLQVDPNDAGSWFHLGQCLEQSGGEPARIHECYETAHRLDPYLAAAAHALQSHLRKMDPAAADAMMARSEQLRAAKQSHVIKDTYTDEGSRYSEVIGKLNLKSDAEAAPLPLFQQAERFRVMLALGTTWAKAGDFGPGPVADLRRAVRQRFGATMIRLDYNDDGRPDLFLTGAVVENGQVRDLLLRNDGDGSFTDVTREAGLAEPRPSLGCCAGDYDNDGHTDLFISGAGVQKLFRNKGDGTFEDVSSKCQLDKLNAVCLGCSWVDLDQDSDLDLVVARYADTVEEALAQLGEGKPGPGGLAIFLNVGEALPGPLGKPAPGLTTKFQRAPELEAQCGGSGPTVGLAVSDVDADHDLDLVLLEDRQPPAVALNDRLLRFHRAALPSTNGGLPWNGALVLDAGHTERSDLLLLAAGKPPVFLRSQAVAGIDISNCFKPGAIKSPPLKQAQIVDMDLDGWTDVVGLAEDGKPALLHNDRTGRLVHVPEALGLDRDWPKDVVAVLAADFDGDGNPDLLFWSEGSGLQMRRSLGNGNQCVKLRPIGRRDSAPDPSFRTNADGIGTRIALHTSRVWTGLEYTTLAAGLGQSADGVELGIGRSSPGDAVARLRWPDFVVQAEFCSGEKQSGIWRIEEQNRKPTSCPVLLTWDGERFVFVTDFLGEGSVGEMLAAGGTRPPRPEECVKIEPGQLKPRDAYYILKITQPMDELIYLDGLKLIVVDHPSGTDIYPDERFSTGGAPPTQEIYCFRDKLFPSSARDHRGRDATAALRQRDGRMVDDFDHRSWMGFAEDHWVELDFGDQLKELAAGDHVYLVLAGWTDYAYPESIFAAAQAGIHMMPPVLEQLAPDGTWRTVAEIGFPAGLPRVMTKDVTGVLAGTAGKLRLRTNLQVYWDQVYLARTAPAEMTRTKILEVADANLSVRGFLKENRPNRTGLVEYDPAKVVAVPVTRWQGQVTRVGDVTELLSAVDDRFVILAPGDEVTVQFDARRLAPPPEGWTRSFVLRSWGYCKDASPYTATGGNVLPLPFRAMKAYPPGPGEAYPHPSDLKTWHTRRPN